MMGVLVLIGCLDFIPVPDEPSSKSPDRYLAKETCDTMIMLPTIHFLEKAGRSLQNDGHGMVAFGWSRRKANSLLIFDSTNVVRKINSLRT